MLVKFWIFIFEQVLKYPGYCWSVYGKRYGI